MTPPPSMRNKNLAWGGPDDLDIREGTAALILAHLKDEFYCHGHNILDDEIIAQELTPTPIMCSSSIVQESSASITTEINTVLKRTIRNVTPTPSPEHRPSKKARRFFSDNDDASSTATPRKSCTLPTNDDPEDLSFYKTLHSKKDYRYMNPVHIAIRSEVLNVRRTSVSGRIYLQCKHCQHIHRSERAKTSTITPQSIEGIYRAVGRFTKQHVPHCEYIPLHLRGLNAKEKVVKNGSKKYWIKAAKKMGLRDGHDGKSITYAPPSI